MNIHEKIDSYSPSESVRELVQETKIALLVGISGAGKDTIKHELLKSDDFRDIISHTTRPPRHNNGVMEIPDVDYHFVNEHAAEILVDERAFVEVKYVHGTVYGTTVEALKSAHRDGKIAITDIDVQGVNEYKKLSGNVVAIFILPPDFDTWQQRLRQRYDSDTAYQEEWPKRRASAIRELRYALEEVPYFHFVLNDDLARTTEVISEIAHKPDVYHRKDDEVRLLARQILASIIEHE